MKTLRNAILVGLVTTMIWSVRAQDDAAAKKDLAALQGEWSMVSGSADGQPMPDNLRTQMKRICKGDETSVTMDGQPFFRAKISLDPTKKPKTIDYAVTEGSNKGKTQLGIYELDGDTLKSCFAAPGAERPTDFTGKEGEHRTVSIWKRNKSATAPSEQK